MNSTLRLGALASSQRSCIHIDSYVSDTQVPAALAVGVESSPLEDIIAAGPSQCRGARESMHLPDTAETFVLHVSGPMARADD
jgi:hypothetical protein